MGEQLFTLVPSDRALQQAIVALKKGAHLLKYGRRRKPKFCPFRLSTDEKLLIWYSGEEERQLRLSTVTNIIRGQRTKQLQSEVESQSLSIIYANGERSLDLICKDKEQADSWFLGLRAVISGCNRPRPFGTCENRRVAQSCVNSPAGFMRRKRNLGLSEETRKHSQVHSLSGSPTLSFSERCFSDGLSCSSDSFYSETSLSTIQMMDNSVPYTEPHNLKKRAFIKPPSDEDKNVLRDVFIWGQGFEGGCSGGGIHYNSFLPKLLESTKMLDVEKVSLGGKHSALVTKQGEVFCWGEGKGGKLGHRVDFDVPFPKLVDSMIGVHVDSIYCGEYQTCALSNSGELYTWGESFSGADLSQWRPCRFLGLLDGVKISTVACGEWHTAVVSSSGRLFTFGDGTFGVLGHGNLESISQPKEVESLKGLRVKSAACGPWHTAAIVDVILNSNDGPNGKLFTWGDGDKGKLGHANDERKLVPTCVAQVVDRDFVRVSCGRMVTLGLTNTGTVYTMGNGKSISTVQGKLKHEFVREISSGSCHVAILTSRGNVYTWGKGGNGQLGVGDSEDRESPTLVEALRGKQVESITCGPNSTAVICLHKPVSCNDQSACRGCSMAFGFTRKKHNCYNCGLLFCHACSNKKCTNASLAPEKKRHFRVCDPCFNHLQRSPMMENLTPRSLLTTPKRSIHRENFSESQPKRSCDEDSQVNEKWGQVDPPEYFKKFHQESRTMKMGSSYLSESNKNLAVEVEKLRAQAESLEKLSEIRSKKIQECQEKTAETWSFAKEEAAKYKAAKEFIKALTSRLQVMTQKPSTAKDEIGPSLPHVKSSCTGSRALESVHPMFIVTTPRPETGQQLDDENVNTVDNSSILFSDNMKAMHNSNGNRRLAEEPCCVRREKEQNGKMKEEWVEQYQSGVYITFTTLPSGQRGLKRVRFSRKRFSDKEAQSWWEQNQQAVYQKYEIEGYNMSPN